MSILGLVVLVLIIIVIIVVIIVVLFNNSKTRDKEEKCENTSIPKNPQIKTKKSSPKFRSDPNSKLPKEYSFEPIFRTLKNVAVFGGSAIRNSGDTDIKGIAVSSPGGLISGLKEDVVKYSSTDEKDINAVRIQKDVSDLWSHLGKVGSRKKSGYELISGDIGGKTLIPGIYKSTSAISIHSGDLTLDARGNKKAKFIFQLNDTFTISSKRNINLIGGAKENNVFWISPSIVTIGKECKMAGTIISAESIILSSDAKLVGRVFAKNGVVSLTQNGVKIPEH